MNKTRININFRDRNTINLVLFMLYMFIEYFCPDEAVKFCETLTNNKQERT
jgi:hypothetical protein